MAQKRAKTDPFEDLTWGDLEEWAGAAIVSRGRSYQRGRRVQNLARSGSGGLVAWVLGTHRYATVVEAKDGNLTSFCTCPYGGTCKHAVAVVLEYLECLKQKREVPAVAERDRRLRLLDESRQEEDARDEEESWDEEGEDEEYDEDGEDEDTVRTAPRRAKKVAADTLSTFLEQQSKEQLVTLLKEQAKRHPTVRQDLQDRRNLSSGAVKKLVKAVREEINELDSKPDWDDDWGGGGSSGDYARIRERLEALLAAGHTDEVVSLGEELLEAGTRRVETTDDEGETAEEIASCMDLVFRALPQSSLSPAEQMLWAIDAELDDQYELCRGAEAFWKQDHPAADWNIVAEKLAQRLKQYKATKGEDSFSRSYRRDHLSDRLIEALENAGRHEEIIPLCEREAEETGSYLRLVDALKKAKRWEEAEQWIYKGIKATQKRWPGIAGQLRTALRELREREKDWPRVAAFHAEDFFQQPELHTFQELQKAAERAGALTNQLLAFSRRQILQIRMIDLNVVVRETEGMLRRLLDEAIGLEVVVGDDPGFVNADPTQLQQILMNLVVNARDAMEAGGKITIMSQAISVEESLPGMPEDVPPGSYVRLSVMDTGTGISPEVLPKIFEPFFTTKAVGRGTGLGLATVNGIVHQSGGRILVESRVKQGTAFHVYFPRFEGTVVASLQPAAT